MSGNLFIKGIKRRNKSKDFLLPFNIINLSNDPSLKDVSITPLIKIKNYNNNFNSVPKKINQGTNTIYSILKKAKNKNKHNYFNVKRKRLFPDLDDNKYIEGLNSSTIRSNGKFQMPNDNKNNKLNINNTNQKFFIRQNIKKFILNGNNFNNFNLNNKKKKNKQKFKNKQENSKKDSKDNDWKGLNISSHYLGNTFNNKFGITTNKFCINKNFVLTHSKENKKYEKDYSPNSFPLDKQNKTKLKFITLNIPNNNNFFNGMSTTNVFSRVKCAINNENLYQKLISQMTIVFKNRIKKYSNLKSYEKQHKSNFNEDVIYKNNILNMKQQKLFIDNNSEIEKIKQKNAIIFERNELFSKKNNYNYIDKYSTFDIHNKYMKINIRNENKNNNIINNTLSKDDMDMYINKKK